MTMLVWIIARSGCLARRKNGWRPLISRQRKRATPCRPRPTRPLQDSMRQLTRVSIAARLVREIGGFLCTRPAKVNWPGGVVSFTFDDFPRSAWVSGGAILEQYDRRGTYYAALGMAGTENHLGPMFTPDDLRQAHAHG